jgi:hypothetical protein
VVDAVTVQRKHLDQGLCQAFVIFDKEKAHGDVIQGQMMR